MRLADYHGMNANAHEKTGAIAMNWLPNMMFTLGWAILGPRSSTKMSNRINRFRI